MESPRHRGIKMDAAVATCDIYEAYIDNDGTIWVQLSKSTDPDGPIWAYIVGPRLLSWDVRKDLPHEHEPYHPFDRAGQEFILSHIPAR